MLVARDFSSLALLEMTKEGVCLDFIAPVFLSFRPAQLARRNPLNNVLFVFNRGRYFYVLCF
jgi:hypothetical protein